MTDLFNEFADIGRRASTYGRDDEPLHAVTVRLNPVVLCKVDTLASHAGMSRQKVLTKIIESGISTAIGAFLEAAPDLSEQFEHNLEECVERFLMENDL